METMKIQGGYNDFSLRKKRKPFDYTRIKVRNIKNNKTSHWYTDAPAREVMASIIATEEAIAYAMEIEPYAIEAIEVKEL